ncbi:hypothetical protein DFH06DRAFT_1125890 [Mycena polygramma]|nr:hypothetical protein DFH06DRAFT_1125890 [Mycena polygramma]
MPLWVDECYLSNDAAAAGAGAAVFVHGGEGGVLLADNAAAAGARAAILVDGGKDDVLDLLRSGGGERVHCWEVVCGMKSWGEWVLGSLSDAQNSLSFYTRSAMPDRETNNDTPIVMANNKKTFRRQKKKIGV